LVQTANEESKEAILLKWILKQKGKEINRFVISVYLREWTLPQ